MTIQTMAKEIKLYKTKAQQVEVKRRIPLGIKKHVANTYREGSILSKDYKPVYDGRA